MPSTGSRLQFIEDIAKYVQKYGPRYDIKICSPIIAQANIESKYGESGLAQYHNYFGLKCGSKWKGSSVNMHTREEYSPGELTDISANFRTYSSMEEGVKGYFDFINVPRYSNLKNVTNPLTYVTNIKNDGYATSSTYVNTIMNNIDVENLTRFDTYTQPSVVPNSTKYSPDVIISIAKSCLGLNEADGSYKGIIDLYNTQNPLPQGYKVKYTDAWCATFVSACAIKAEYTNIIPTECSCERMINLFKGINCWVEDESVTPKVGWVIFYDWQDNGVGDNMGHSDHVGYVMSVSGGSMQVIEGNYNDAVGIRTLNVNGRYIRGYGVPMYNVESTSNSSIVLPEPPKPSSNIILNKLSKYKAEVNTHKLNVRTWAGSGYSMVSFSPLSEGTVVDVCDTIKASNNDDWNYIKYNGKYGFCSAKYLTKLDKQDFDERYTGTYEVRVSTELNLRSTPNKSDKNNILAKLSNTTKVTGLGQMVVSEGTEWIKVSYKNMQGYCSSKYLVKL